VPVYPPVEVHTDELHPLTFAGTFWLPGTARPNWPAAQLLSCWRLRLTLRWLWS